MITHYERKVNMGKGDNYILGDENIRELVKQDIKEYETINKRSVRGNGCVLMDWCVQVPPEIEGDKELRKKFYQCSYDFFKQKYKDFGFITKAYIHDFEINQSKGNQARPHIHIAVLPYGKFIDRKSKKEKIGFSADNHTGMRDYIFTHKEYYKYMANQFGFELKGLKANKNRSQDRKDREQYHEIATYNLILDFQNDIIKNERPEIYTFYQHATQKAVKKTQEILESKNKITLSKRIATFFTNRFGFVFKSKLHTHKQPKEKSKDKPLTKQ